MIGQPDYEAYVAHVRQTHPDEPAMTREEFFLNRQDRRFGGGAGAVFKCC
jgi:uncharacterized short protein YbdD (DUF466 family)